MVSSWRIYLDPWDRVIYCIKARFSEKVMFSRLLDRAIYCIISPFSLLDRVIYCVKRRFRLLFFAGSPGGAPGTPGCLQDPCFSSLLDSLWAPISFTWLGKCPKSWVGPLFPGSGKRVRHNCGEFWVALGHVGLHARKFPNLKTRFPFHC